MVKKNLEPNKFITLRFGTIAGLSRGIRFHTAVNKFCLNASLNLPIPVWKMLIINIGHIYLYKML